MIDDDETISLLTLYRDFSTVQNWLAAKPIRKFKAGDRRWTGKIVNSKIDATASASMTLTLLPWSNHNEIYFGKGNDKLNLLGVGNSIYMGAGRNEANVFGSNNIIRSGNFANFTTVRSVTRVTGNSNQVFLSTTGEYALLEGLGNSVKAEGRNHTIELAGNNTSTKAFNAFISVSQSHIKIAEPNLKIALDGESNDITFTWYEETYVRDSITIDGRGNFGAANTLNLHDYIEQLFLSNGNFHIVSPSSIYRKFFYFSNSKANVQNKYNLSIVESEWHEIYSDGHNVQITGDNNKAFANGARSYFIFSGTNNKLHINRKQGAIYFVDNQYSGLNIDLANAPRFTDWGVIDFSTRGTQLVNFLTGETQKASYEYKSDGSVHIKVNDHVVFRATGMEFKVDSLLLNGKSIFF